MVLGKVFGRRNLKKPGFKVRAPGAGHPFVPDSADMSPRGELLYPSVLLDLRPGQSRAEAERMVQSAAPEFELHKNVFDGLNYYSVCGRYDERGCIESINFTMRVLDDISIDGIRLRMPIEEALAIRPELRFAEYATKLHQSFGRKYRAAGLENSYDLEIVIREGNIYTFSLHRKGWVEEQEKRDRESLVNMKANEEQRRVEEQWKTISDPDEMIETWSKSMRAWQERDNRWRWYVDRLRSSTPDEWHDAARHWNFDYDLAPLIWILRQPMCDKATALQIFYLLEPWHYADRYGLNRDAVIDRDLEVYDLCSEIRSKFEQGFYTRSELSFDTREYTDTPEADPETLDFIPASMRLSLTGRTPLDGIFLRDCPAAFDFS